MLLRPLFCLLLSGCFTQVFLYAYMKEILGSSDRGNLIFWISHAAPFSVCRLIYQNLACMNKQFISISDPEIFFKIDGYRGFILGIIP